MKTDTTNLGGYMDAHGADELSRTERRYWRRRDTVAGWWPWGILPLAGLLALFLIGWLQTAPAIEAQTHESIEQLLERRGVDVRNIEVDGTRVHIEAAAGQYDEAQLRAFARSAECRTWAGQLVCPSSVEVKLLADASPEMSAAKPEAVTEPRFHDFEFSLTGDEITLTGEIAHEKIRADIVSRAESRFSRVVDRLSPTGGIATPQYPTAAVHALDTLALLESGTATWTQGKFGATGVVSSEREAALQSLAQGAGLELGDLSFRTVRSVASCNEEFATALSQSSINFRSGSAEIEDSSLALLERLARLASQCPGTLTIAGHTDNVGEAGMNLALSEGRAAAVRDALTQLGVVSERLKARGYGESQPVADNGTREGRARNRRISIELSENSDL